MNARTARTGGMAKRIAAVMMTMALLVSLSSCQQFFTASLATFLARDSYTIPADLPVGDAIDLLDSAKASGDEQLAAALVTPLYNAAVAATPGSAAYDVAAGALLDAAVLASGVNTAMVSVMNAYVDGAADLANIAVGAVASISLSAEAAAGLRMIATDNPADLSVEDAYAAAVALLAYGATENSIDLAAVMVDGVTPAQTTTLNADASVQAAIDLLNFVTANAVPGTIFADLPSADLLAQLGL